MNSMSVNPYQPPIASSLSASARHGATTSRGFWSIGIASIAGGVCFTAVGIGTVFLLERVITSIGPLIAVSAMIGAIAGLPVALMTCEGILQIRAHLSGKSPFPTDWPASLTVMLLCA